jgi:hypothetical protein
MGVMPEVQNAVGCAAHYMAVSMGRKMRTGQQPETRRELLPGAGNSSTTIASRRRPE